MIDVDDDDLQACRDGAFHGSTGHVRGETMMTRSAPQPAVRLARGREASLLRRHPWVFSGAIDRVEGQPASGDAVIVLDAGGNTLGEGTWSPQSQIRVRMWHFENDKRISDDFVRERLRRAIVRRHDLLADPLGACRLVFSEGDGLPGLVVDRYGNFLVIQFLSTGTDARRDTITAYLSEELNPEGIFERSEGDARTREGLPRRVGTLYGDEPPVPIEFAEEGVRYLVDVKKGHKTGFYLDQRTNRGLVAGVARGRTMLNAFSYTGGFGIAALVGGARHVVEVDTSAPALDTCRSHMALNGLDAQSADHVEGDVFRVLRDFKEADRRFDLIVLDPPKFADKKSQVDKAARGYKDINRLAFHLLEPGGLLFTFSCSGAISADLFQKIVASGALDAGVEATMERRLMQATDHPVDIHFPESEYLKGLVCRRLA